MDTIINLKLGKYIHIVLDEHSIMDSINAIQEALDAQLSGYDNTFIKLPSCNIKDFPLSLLSLDNKIKTFNLSFNSINLLPEYINESGISLNLEYNKLKDTIKVPMGIKELFVNSNNIKSIVSTNNLIYLNAMYNKIVSITGNICNLKFLNISNNNISELDVSLSKLQVLKCDNNKLNKLPKVPDCITCLMVSSNNISGTVDLCKYPNITTFCCTGNNIESIKLSKSIKILAASSNPLKKNVTLNVEYLQEGRLSSCGIESIIINAVKLDKIILNDNPLKKIVIRCSFTGRNIISVEKCPNLLIISPFHLARQVFKNRLNGYGIKNNYQRLDMIINSAAFTIQKLWKAYSLAHTKIIKSTKTCNKSTFEWTANI